MKYIDEDTTIGLSMKALRGIIQGKVDVDNANLQDNPETKHKIIADLVSKDYYLKTLPKEISKAHIDGELHLHDLSYLGTRPFCRSWDLRPILMYGFKPDGGIGAIDAGPAMHAEVAILQATKTLAMGQTQHSGGQGLLYGLVFLSPFMQGKPYKRIKQLMQMMIYELNQMYISRGGQVIFSSINISPGVPKVLENVPVVYKGILWDGETQPYDKVDSGIYSNTITYPRKVYGDYEKEVRLMFKAIMEIAEEGDATHKPFPFPKLEVSVENKFIDPEKWNDRTVYSNGEMVVVPSYRDLYKACFEVTSKFGTIYFDNLLIDGKNGDNVVGCTQCCSYSFQSDEDTDKNFEKKLGFIDDHHFNLGGYQVVSLNLPRAAYKSNHDDKALIARIYDLMDRAIELFKIKKEMIYNQSKNGTLTFLNQVTPKGVRFTDWDELVFDMGIVGFAEMLEYHYGKPVINDFGVDEDVVEGGKKILSQMRDYCKMQSEFTGMKIVLSRTPAETTAQRFAVCDLMSDEYREMAKPLIKGDVETAINNLDKTRNLPIYYSNGFAPDVQCNAHYRLRVESEFWQFVDGGAITHVWLSEDEPDPDSLMDFTLKLLKNSNIGYLTYTKDLSECARCHKMMSGIQTKCGYCGHDEIIIRSRITGYYSVAGIMTKGVFNRRWNAGKAEELFNRKRTTLEELDAEYK